MSLFEGFCQRNHSRHPGFRYLAHQLCVSFAVWIHNALPRSRQSSWVLLQHKPNKRDLFDSETIILNSIALKVHHFWQYARAVSQNPREYVADSAQTISWSSQ